MAELLFAFETVFPLLFYLFLGLLLKRFRMLEENTAGQLNTLVFKVFLPLSIFRNIYTASLDGAVMGKAVIFAFLAIAIVFLAAWFFYSRIEKNQMKLGVLIQNAFRSNFVLFGIPLSQILLRGESTGVTELLITVVVPLFNVLAVFILQYYGEGQFRLKKLLLGILQNPLIQAVFVGLFFKLLPFQLPTFVMSPIGSVGGIATPLALMVLGSRFQVEESKLYRKDIILGVFLRLILVPALAITSAIALGFRGETLVAFLAVFASPVAVASYAMAQAMGQDYRLAGQLLAFTSLLCSFTLFLFIFILRSLQFI